MGVQPRGLWHLLTALPGPPRPSSAAPAAPTTATASQVAEALSGPSGEEGLGAGGWPHRQLGPLPGAPAPSLPASSSPAPQLPSGVDPPLLGRLTGRGWGPPLPPRGRRRLVP